MNPSRYFPPSCYDSLQTLKLYCNLQRQIIQETAQHINEQQTIAKRSICLPENRNDFYQSCIAPLIIKQMKAQEDLAIASEFLSAYEALAALERKHICFISRMDLYRTSRDPSLSDF